jgi:hypothetical protein
MQNLQEVYTPEELLTVDKAICALQVRMYFRIYMKGKPYKYDIWMFELRTEKSGYVCMLAHTPKNVTTAALLK